jgi:hypothetical protein
MFAVASFLMRAFLAMTVAVLCLCGSLLSDLKAEENARNRLSAKSRYTLSNPTPPDSLREFSTDRPDKTESAYTVDAGHFQIEADLLSYSYDRHNAAKADVRVDSFSFAALNLKAGLLNDLDVQLVIPTYNYVRTEDRVTKTVQRNSGLGDLTVRAKYNIWGNDSGKTALAIMPFIKAPTAQDNLGNDEVEGGIILPFAMGLPHEWDMGLMTEVDINKDGTGSGHHAEFINSITFSHEIVSKLGGYVEFFSAVSAESNSDWVGTVDFGLVYELAENINLDGGLNVGVTRAADDLNPFLGISLRF